MTEYEAAMLALREREVAAMEAHAINMAKAAAASESVANESDVEVWRRYVVGRAQNPFTRTAAEARDFANDMLKHDQARWPR